MIVSLVRGLNVLSLVAERGGLRVDALAAGLDMPLSTAYRYVDTLSRSGFVEEVDGTYVLGGRFLRLARLHNRHDRVVRLAHPVLRSLVEHTRETALLTVRAGAMALCLDRVESPWPVRLSFETGTLRPLHAGASAKVLLAFAPDDVVRDVLRGDLTAATAATPGMDELPGQLAEIRARGYAVTCGEVDPYAIGVAVPVFANGELVCALSVAGPATRLDDTAVPGVLAELQRAAPTLAARLGPARAAVSGT